MTSSSATCSVIVAIIVAGFMTVPSVTALRTTNTDGCVNNITNGIEQVLSASEQIGLAVIDCSAHQTAKCVADIAACSGDIAGAAADISNAVEACGGRGSNCATQLLLLGKDLSQTANEVALAADYCTNSTDIVECVIDVVDIAATVGKIVESIKNAVEDCKSNSTKLDAPRKQ